MVKNLEYMKGMLEVFLKAKTPFISTKDLAEAGYDICSNEGMFHYLLLIEQGYISNKDLITNDITKLGYMRHRGYMLDMGTEVRLSAQGQEFAQALNEPTVFEKLKSMSDAPLSTIKDVGLELTKAYLKKKFGLE
ncbi:hypothetical protein [Citrobacter sp. wls615]|uniref:hypothetical protein n=1 Tax=Citrobacter TaxID=544 RepID=UPI000DB1AC24|nr:hypothetical protein [Citrobacter sp. wls615]PZR23140.1 MAG: hypothetical protein DI535_24565 [Citrobacter freundii]TKV15601.1 hypothetical protein FDX04_08025 [Citrobacter sp. wls615]